MKSPPIPGKRRPAPAKAPTRRVTINQVVERAAALTAAGKLPEAIALLQQGVDGYSADHGPGPTLIDLLIQASSNLRMQHPAASAMLARAAVERDPELTAGWTILTGVCDRLGELAEAKEACLKVVQSPQAKPDQVMAAANLLVRYKEDQIAIDAARKAFEELGRPLPWASALMYIAQRVADFPLIDQLAAQLREAHKAGRTTEARESPRTNLLWCDDEATNIAVLKDWSLANMPGETGTPPPPTSLEGRRLRVGYLSSDFRDHPTSRLINGLLRHHDRASFEIILYDSGWDDGSAMRKEVVSHVDQLHLVANLSDEDAARLIRSHGVDVLVELNGPTRANRMGILKFWPAPVQIDYLGWPGSVGGRVVDYVVGDSYCVPPGAEKLYPEKVIRLQRVYQLNDYAAREVPAVPSRKELGLPEGVPLIGMFNAINKVHGEVWAVWMRIMKAVPEARLWILDPGPVARRNIAKACATHGVDPKRVLAAPAARQEAHLARLQQCDVMVDPWPYGGHTSTSDALFAGVPVVAVAGTNFASRVSGALLRAAGLEALVQPTLDGYVSAAVKLLTDRAELARVKEFIRTNIQATDIFDAASKTRQFETAYRTVYTRKLEGKPLRHITFTPRGEQAVPAAPAAVPAAAPARAPARPVSAGTKLPLVLVCGPWSSGTSAVAGLLARAGLFAPGPYITVNDPKTPITYEMRAFQQLMQQLASEHELKLTATPADIVKALTHFRDTTLRDAWEAAGGIAAGPIMLKHALTALMLPQICEVFDTRLIAVIRQLKDIEATRARRKWHPSMGSAGARIVYAKVFEHLIASSTPFTVLRYADMLATPGATLDNLAAFCGMQVAPERRADALAFVSRPPVAQQPAAAQV